ncbi:MAG: endonuclease/exonuclease/phosphatase, partial [Bacteroidia bacterium]|nr:endonuclease/exonuclease/phosphatase [Bacteroidia bacterium]
DRLCKGRKDSFMEAGKGLGATYAPLWPLLRIDYILYPDEYECYEHTTHKIGLSDHYPISATIII